MRIGVPSYFASASSFLAPAASPRLYLSLPASEKKGEPFGKCSAASAKNFG
jgi:hypothetical protein